MTHEQIQDEFEKIGGFYQFMAEKHGETYFGFDDDMPDKFNDWYCELDKAELKGLYKEYEGKINV